MGTLLFVVEVDFKGPAGPVACCFASCVVYRCPICRVSRPGRGGRGEAEVKGEGPTPLTDQVGVTEHRLRSTGFMEGNFIVFLSSIRVKK